MTIWTPDLTGREGPLYRAIEQAIADAVVAGELTPGDRLPTHRALARELGVTVGTVSRAYVEAENRGLVIGEVGRGTFVRAGEGPDAWTESRPEERDDLIDLGFNFPACAAEVERRILSDTLRELSTQPDLARLLAYQRYPGTLRHREAGVRWIQLAGLETSPEEVIICAGGQHALDVVFATLTRPDDAILTAAVTYPGMKSLAQMLHLRLRGLPVDEFGLIPEAIDAACEEDDIRALYCVPTLQNPTTAIMTDERRHAVAEVARKHDLLIIEDDAYAFLSPVRQPPIATFAPERTCYILSTGKTVAPTLRIAFLRAPEDLISRLAAGVRATTWMASPLLAEIAARWIETGKTEEILRAKRTEIELRHRVLQEVLGEFRYRTHAGAIHVWLELPEPWRSDDFVSQARLKGVRVTGAETFAVGRDAAPHAVRLCIGSPATAAELRRGLGVLEEILSGRSEPSLAVV